MEDVHDPYQALRISDYRRFLAGAILATIANEMQTVAVGWELYQRTNSALSLGLVGLVQFLPVILLSLVAGHVADRYSRQRVVVAARSLMTVASLGLALLAYIHGPVPLIYLCLLLTGVGQSFYMPARWALLPQIVPDKAITNAVTWNSSGMQTAMMLGPALGGLIIYAAGDHTGWAYLLAAFASLACIGLIGSVNVRAAPRQHQPLSLGSLLAGIDFVRRTRLILATITLDLFAVLLGGATALLPIFARDILQVGPAGLGWLRAAPSAGACTMALMLAHRPPLRRTGVALVAAVAGFGVATVIFGVSENFALSFAMLAMTGALDNISVVVRSTLIQVLTPDEMRGRVSAVNALFVSSSNQLGAFESGVTAEWFGPVWSVVGGGVGTVLVVGAVMLLWPEVLRLGPLHLLRPLHPDDSTDKDRERSLADEA